jgi:iron complex outermembrane receptor protein
MKASELILGGAWNQYSGNHFGEIIWAQYASNADIRHRYYDNGALKTDFNVFAKIYFDLFSNLNVFGDLQWRRVGYNFSAFDDQLNFVPQTVQHDFVNPKFGVTFKPDGQQTIYSSVSTAHREPSRDDYTEASSVSRPKPEGMIDFEAGYRIQKRVFFAALNCYHMKYKNQLVLTGKVNDVGNYTRTNIADSYRQGIELETGYRFNKYFSFKGNCTLSRNKIKKFIEFLDDYDIGEQITIPFENTDISFSPSVIGAGDLEIKPAENISVHLLGKYAGKQYLNNSSDNECSLNPYFITDVRIDFTGKLEPFKEISFGILTANILNEEYESNGYTYSYRFGGEKITENFYYPQAGRNFLAQLTVKF